MVFVPLLNDVSLDVELSVLVQLRDLLGNKHYKDIDVFIPTVYENISDPRRELITICSCMQNNENGYVKKLYEKYAKMSYLMFLKFAQPLPCTVKMANTVKQGRIIGVNKNKEFAIDADDARYIVQLMLPKKNLFGGKPSLSDTVGVTSSNTVKSKNMIHSTGVGYSAGSSDNYFSESTSGADDGLCE